MELIKIFAGALAVLIAWVFIFRTPLILKINAWIREHVFSDTLILFSGRRLAVLLLILGVIAIFSGLEEVGDERPIPPNIAVAMIEQAKINLKDGQHSQAIRRAKELVRADPQNREAWDILATAFWANGQKERAVQAAESLLRLDPTHPIAKTPIGAMLAARKKQP